MIYRLLTGQMTPEEAVGLLVALVFGITVHEFSHALAATWLGDSLPGRQGRLTLQPAAHLELMGSLMFLVGGFGWGKPVQYNPYALRTNPRTGGAIIAAAGPLSNFILASIISVIVRILPFAFGMSIGRLANSSGSEGILFNLLVNIVYYNLILCFFNLLPVFPLDGFSILLGLLPPELADRFEATRQYGMFIMILLLVAGGSVLGSILYGPVERLLLLLIGG